MTARLIRAVKALGTMPEGYCFCASYRVGDDSKIHEPECADVRAALAWADIEMSEGALAPHTLREIEEADADRRRT